MALWRNLAAGLGASLLGAVVALVTAPILLRMLGIEAYGLIGFFVALQAVFGILDLGLSPTMSREIARSQVTGNMREARDLLRTLGLLYWIAAGLIALATAIGARWLAQDWLQARHIAPDMLVRSVTLMGVVIALRFPVGLYTGVLLGAQRVTRVSAIQLGMSLLGNVGVIVVLLYFSRTIEAYFAWQLVVAVVQVALARALAWRAASGEGAPRFDTRALGRVWRFSAGMGVVAVLGVLLTQLDKMVLSRMADLSELGRYTLAGLAARSLTLAVGPVMNVIYPRLSALVADNDTPRIIALYTLGTRLLLAVVLPTAIYVSVFSIELFTLWTHNHALAVTIQPIVTFLLLGTALNAAMTFPYALQLAHGHSRLPAIIVATLVIGFVPLLLGLVRWHGAVGAAAAWAILNAAYIPFGAWLTHRHILRGLGGRWLTRDVGMPVLVTAIIVGGLGAAVQSLPLDARLQLGIGAMLVPIAFALIVALTPSFAVEAGRWRARLGRLALRRAIARSPRRPA